MTAISCAEPVPDPPWYLNEHACPNKAKWLADGRGLTDHPVCGVHARWYRKHGQSVRPIEVAE